MKTAVDTSVLLDVLAGDPRFGNTSREALRSAYDAGALVACDVVWAEVRAHFETTSTFEQAMRTLGVEFLPTSTPAAALAGSLWRTYRARRPRAAASGKRVVADFLVGAHAQVQADVLLARDRGFFRDYFKDLELQEPR